MDGWMFELFIDAQPQKGISRLNDYKYTILHYELVWKKTKEIQDRKDQQKRLIWPLKHKYI